MFVANVWAKEHLIHLIRNFWVIYDMHFYPFRLNDLLFLLHYRKVFKHTKSYFLQNLAWSTGIKSCIEPYNRIVFFQWNNNFFKSMFRKLIVRNINQLDKLIKLQARLKAWPKRITKFILSKNDFPKSFLVHKPILLKLTHNSMLLFEVKRCI